MIMNERIGRNARWRDVRNARWRDVAEQFALVFAAAIFYFFVRSVTQGSTELAERNADTILRIERWLRLDVEVWAQELIVDRPVLVTLSNWVYIWGHWPVIIVTLYALHRWKPVHYLRFRNALFVSGAIGIVIYMSLPVAPPRLLDPVYQDTVTDHSTSYRVLQPPALVNKYAAMPSLHAGWNLLAGIALYGATTRRGLRAISVAGPIAMALAVVLTANHFVLDVIAGEVVALIGLALSRYWWPHPEVVAVAERGQTTDLGDQREIIDDEATHAGIDEFDRTIGVVDGPDDDVVGESKKSLRYAGSQQPLVDRDAVRRPPTANPADRPELRATAHRSHRTDTPAPRRAQNPPTA